MSSLIFFEHSDAGFFVVRAKDPHHKKSEARTNICRDLCQSGQKQYRTSLKPGYCKPKSLRNLVKADIDNVKY